jgi:hypothetical protein
MIGGTTRRGRVLRLLLSIPLAFALTTALTAIGAAGSCTRQWTFSIEGGCSGPTDPSFTGGGGGGGGGGGATPTAVPTAPPTPGSGGTSADYTAIENLPSASVVPNTTYHATFNVCEAGQPGGCFVFIYNYVDSPGWAGSIVDPCCMGIVLTEQVLDLVVTNGTGVSGYQPHPHLTTTVEALSQTLFTLGIASTCPLTFPTPPSPVYAIGCIRAPGNVDNAPLMPSGLSTWYFDGAHEVDNLTIDGDADLIPTGGNTQNIDHKFY